MSFDLYVWHEPAPIGVEEAVARVAAGPSRFAWHPAVPPLRESLLVRFPDGDGSVWSVPPSLSGGLLTLSLVGSRSGEVTPVVRAAAAAAGLVCFDPQEGVLKPNSPGLLAGFRLTSEAYPAVADPDVDRLERVARRLGPGNGYVVLERADGWFVQSAYRPGGGFAIEYRQGPPESHMVAETADVGEVALLLREFRSGGSGFQRRHGWTRLF